MATAQFFAPPDAPRHFVHYFEKFPGSFALIAEAEDVDQALVFVHGFGGDASGTWADFHLLIDDLERTNSLFARSDLFFFDYSGVWERIASSVNRLLKFLDEVVPTPNPDHFQVNSSPILVEKTGLPVFLSVLPGERRYEKIKLIGHSEGGVVIRQAILDADSSSRANKWSLLRSQLALFAPAIFGYKPSGFFGTLANFPGLGSVVHAFLSASPAYQDLSDPPEILIPLRTATEKLAREGAHPACQASILWSRRDHIVKQGKYGCDSEEYVEGRSHTQVCKPRFDYSDPIDFVLR